MPSLLVTGSDTGVGKTHVTAALARWLAGQGNCVQIIKVVETGRTPADRGDADRALELALGNCGMRISDCGLVLEPRAPGIAGAQLAVVRQSSIEIPKAKISSHTLATFPEPISPASAAARVGRRISIAALVAAARELPETDWRIFEGAGGIATPLDAEARDWADFAVAAKVDAVVVVVADRLGAINQSRLAFARAQAAGVPAGIWLNAIAPTDSIVAVSTREGLEAAAVPIWAEQRFGEVVVVDPDRLHLSLQRIASAAPAPHSAIGPASESKIGNLKFEIGREPSAIPPSSAQSEIRNAKSEFSPASALRSPQSAIRRWSSALAERDRQQLRRKLRVTVPSPDTLNLADNDYLDLAHDPVLVAATAAAAARYGTSASASPLVTGWREPHAALIEKLAAWHGVPYGLLWSSGYAANAAVLSGLPAEGDLIFADRFIHHSMIAGLLRSGARLQRYDHLDLDRLERLLAGARPSGRPVFVATESVFSMDGDYPDLHRMAELKQAYGFFWILDEAHALGWYGPRGAGLMRTAGVERDVDVLVGTFGKALAGGGAYALFHDELVRDFLINTAGEFIYSTALPPTTVAVAAAAIDRAGILAADQPQWHEISRTFRNRLREAGWDAKAGDSPIVPVQLNDPGAAVELAEALRAQGIVAAAIRPPTVPAGTSRLRLSLKRTLASADIDRVLAAMDAWRNAR